MITRSRLLDVLAYDAATGVFTWRLNRGRLAKIGDVAGRIQTKGYIQITIDGKSYMAHRLAWLVMTGRWPENEIDHRNRVRTDNRFTNLRESTHTENLHNMIRPNNTSGIKGITWHKASKKWYAQISAYGRKYYLGIFDDLDDAVNTYRKRAEELHGDFVNHG